MKETKEIRMEKENRIRWGGRKMRMVASISQQCWNAAKSVGSFCIPEEAVRPDGWHFGKKTESEKSAA